MSLFEELAGTALWGELGLVLLHFLWQGTLVAALATVFLCALKQRSAAERYTVGCVALFAMLALPAGTWLWLERCASEDAYTVFGLLTASPSPQTAPAELDWLAVLGLVWLAGTLLQQLRLLLCYLRAGRLRRREALHGYLKHQQGEAPHGVLRRLYVGDIPHGNVPKESPHGYTLRTLPHLLQDGEGAGRRGIDVYRVHPDSPPHAPGRYGRAQGVYRLRLDGTPQRSGEAQGVNRLRLHKEVGEGTEPQVRVLRLKRSDEGALHIIDELEEADEEIPLRFYNGDRVLRIEGSDVKRVEGEKRLEFIKAHGAHTGDGH